MSQATPETITLRLPPTFFDDHESHDLPSGTEIKRTKTYVEVSLDREAYDDLLSDARYYADPTGGPRDFENWRSLVNSANRTIKILESATRPAPSWNCEDGTHALHMDEGESVINPASPTRRLHGPMTIIYSYSKYSGLDFTVMPETAGQRKNRKLLTGGGSTWA